jgi:transcriptional regulator with XRE-family HTH domain
MSASQSPTVRRRRLGMELRKRRESAGMRIEDVARALECSMSRISRIETGRSVARNRDVRDMLELFGVTDKDECELLAAIAREAQQKGWWSTYEGVLPAGLDTYVGFEESAASLRSFQNSLVTGLLQTEEYARAAVTAARHTNDREEVERLVRLRMRRQKLLTRETPLELWAVLDEALLHRPIGGPCVMRAQLMRLLEATEMPNVTIQVLPFARGGHAGLDGPFTIITFPDPTDLDVVYVPGTVWNALLEREKDVRRHTACFDHLRAEALPPDESAELITEAADGYKSSSTSTV